MASAKDGWAKLAHSLYAEIDPTRMAAYRGAVPLLRVVREYARAAVNTVDEQAVESLKIKELA